jgi:hypothetical protein
MSFGVSENMFPNCSTPSLSPHRFVQHRDFRAAAEQAVQSCCLFWRSHVRPGAMAACGTLSESRPSRIHNELLPIVFGGPASGYSCLWSGRLTQCSEQPGFSRNGSGGRRNRRRSIYGFGPAGSVADVRPAGSFLERDDRCPAGKPGGGSKPHAGANGVVLWPRGGQDRQVPIRRRVLQLLSQ